MNLIYENITDDVIVPILVLLAIAVAGLYYLIKTWRDYRAEIERIEAGGLVPYVTAEFAKPRFANNRVRMGDEFIFIKQGGKVLRYSDIAKIYLQIRKFYGIEASRFIMVVTKNKKTPFNLSRVSKSERESGYAEFIVSIVCEKNPDVHVGYR